MDEYFVPFEDSETEFTEKRSRFIGHVCRVENEEEARAFIEGMKKKYYDARHNCWCYRLHGGNVVRYSDDGEPQGTAGQPMLNVIEREHVENVVCVVTRYFGGILLGTGGLTRAYTKSAKDTLDAAGKAKMQCWSELKLVVPYSLFDEVRHLAVSFSGVMEKTEYSTIVNILLRMPEEKEIPFESALTELSAGSVSVLHRGESVLPGERE